MERKDLGACYSADSKGFVQKSLKQQVDATGWISLGGQEIQIHSELINCARRQMHAVIDSILEPYCSIL